jgi:uncharacterized membrane protein
MALDGNGTIRHMTIRALVIGQFAALVVLLAPAVLLGKFLGGGFEFMLMLLGAPLLVVSTTVVLGWALWPPTRSKLVVALVAVATAVGLVAATPLLARTGDRLFFESRRARLNAFTTEIVAFGRINNMSDGLRHYKQLNGELVAYTDAQVDTSRTPGLRPTLPLDQVLVRDRIDRADYEAFRGRLRDLRLIGLEVHPGFVAYLYDGMLDNLEGYLYVFGDGEPPTPRTELFSTMLVALRPLGHGWYWFATT